MISHWLEWLPAATHHLLGIWSQLLKMLKTKNSQWTMLLDDVRPIFIKTITSQFSQRAIFKIKPAMCVRAVSQPCLTALVGGLFTTTSATWEAHVHIHMCVHVYICTRLLCIIIHNYIYYYFHEIDAKCVRFNNLLFTDNFCPVQKVFKTLNWIQCVNFWNMITCYWI